jgi:hypothetical protein
MGSVGTRSAVAANEYEPTVVVCRLDQVAHLLDLVEIQPTDLVTNPSEVSGYPEFRTNH